RYCWNWADRETANHSRNKGQDLPEWAPPSVDPKKCWWKWRSAENHRSRHSNCRWWVNKKKPPDIFPHSSLTRHSSERIDYRRLHYRCYLKDPFATSS